MVKNVLNTLRKKQKNNKGFSLVELIVVIAIMAVLVGILAPQFIKYVEKSRQSTDMQNVEELKSAVEAEISDNEDIASAKITVTADKATAELTKTGGGNVDLSATSNTVTFKSKGWQPVTYEYSSSDNKWTTNKNDESAKNTKSPNRCMNDVFKGATEKTAP